MSHQPQKLNLDFILNQEQAQPSNAEKAQKRNRTRGLEASSSSDKKDRTSKHSRATGSSSGGSSARAGSSSGQRHLEHKRLFHCEKCPKTFAEKGNLNKHVSSVHLKEKTKICPEPGCGKSFSFRDGLVRHVAHVHKNQRLHICQLCGNSFKQGSHLTKHMRSIHKQSGSA